MTYLFENVLLVLAVAGGSVAVGLVFLYAATKSIERKAREARERK